MNSISNEKIKYKNILNSILSKFLFDLIFSYIGDKYYKYKLFKYSKTLQKKNGINIADYKIKYILENPEATHEFLNLFESGDEKRIKTIVNKYKLTPDFLNNLIKKYIRTKNDLIIDLTSKLFGDLSKLNAFEKLYINIDENISNDEYKYIFDIFNQKLNVNYGSLYLNMFFKKEFNLERLNDIHINLDKIKQLMIGGTRIIFDFSISNMIYILYKFPLVLPSLNIENDSSFEKLNNLKNLETLKISGLNYEKLFMKLYFKNLKCLNFYCCKDIILDENCCLNLEDLKIFKCQNIKSKNNSVLKFPKIENLLILDNKNNNLNIDYLSMKKLKNFCGDSEDFIKLENKEYNCLGIFRGDNIKKKYNDNDNYDYEKTINNYKIVAEKLSSIYISNNICIYDKIKEPGLFNLFSDFKIKNKHLKFLYYNEKIKLLYIRNYKFLNYGTLGDILYHFQSINFLIIEAYIRNNSNKNKKSDFKINSIGGSVLKYIDISVDGNQEINCYSSSYENIQTLNLNFYCEINNLKESFPIFNNNSDIFKELITLHLIIHEKNYDILENIYDNIDKMPKLYDFALTCFSKLITKEFHIKFIKKIISKKIQVIKFLCSSIEFVNLYSNEELKEIIPDFNESNFVLINIFKYE